MGGGSPRARHGVVARPNHPLNRQRRHTAPTPLLVSPLKGGRDELGRVSPSPPHPLRRPRTLSVAPAPPPSFPRPLPVIPAQAGTHPLTNTLPQENSSLPPSRGEVRWGVEARERAQTGHCPPDHPLNRRHRRATPTPLLVSPLKGGRDELGTRLSPSPPRPLPSFLRRQEPTPTPAPKTIHPPWQGGEMNWGAPTPPTAGASAACAAAPARRDRRRRPPPAAPDRPDA